MRTKTFMAGELPTVNKHDSTLNAANKEGNTSTLFAVPSCQRAINLKTLILHIRNGEINKFVRALLDDGSHRSYIERDLVKELNLFSLGKETLSQGLFGGKQTPVAEYNRFCINIEKIDGTFSCQVSVLDQPKICTTLSRVRDKNLLLELESHGRVLTDIDEETPPIRLLLGADVLGRIFSGRIEVLKSGISAIETTLGCSSLGSEKQFGKLLVWFLCAFRALKSPKYGN